jgi:hypothetical protein
MLTVPPGGGARGAVYTPPLVIVPQPPATRLLQCTDQPGEIVAAPTVATNVCCPPEVTVTVAGVTTTGSPEFVMVTLAEPILVVSDVKIAETVTLLGVGTTAGAVYKPLVSMVPNVALPPLTPLTCHVTAVLLVPVTVEVNCCVCLVWRVALSGEIETAISVVVDEELLFLPPQPASEIAIIAAATMAKASRVPGREIRSVPLMCVGRMSKNALQRCHSRKRIVSCRATPHRRKRREAIMNGTPPAAVVPNVKGCRSTAVVSGRRRKHTSAPLGVAAAL